MVLLIFFHVGHGISRVFNEKRNSHVMNLSSNTQYIWTLAWFYSHGDISIHMSILWLVHEFVAKVFTMHVSAQSNMFLVHVIYVEIYVNMDALSCRVHVLRPCEYDLMWFGNWNVVSTLHVNLRKAFCWFVLSCVGFHLVHVQWYGSMFAFAISTPDYSGNYGIHATWA